MKLLISSLCFFFFLFSNISWVSAWFFDDFINNSSSEIRYCNNEGECGIKPGIEITKGEIDGIVTDRTFSQYVQDVVLYLLTFISLIAVIYVIYAWVQILTWNGDEEKLKKSKQTIIYVALGITLIWLAWPITLFIIWVLGA